LVGSFLKQTKGGIGLNKQAAYLFGFAKGANMPLFMESIRFAEQAHEGQKRNDGRDYINHPIETCEYLINLGIRSDELLAAAMLHDVVEDKPEMSEAAKEKFGPEVFGIIDQVSKKKGKTTEDYFSGITDPRAAIIKGMDRVSNIIDMLDVYDSLRLRRYIHETENHVLPLLKKTRKGNVAYGDQIRVIEFFIDRFLRLAKEVFKMREKS
jgi:(p)ppGpp synthase/HD superfamily hydrolase